MTFARIMWLAEDTQFLLYITPNEINEQSKENEVDSILNLMFISQKLGSVLHIQYPLGFMQAKEMMHNFSMEDCERVMKESEAAALNHENQDGN